MSMTLQQACQRLPGLDTFCYELWANFSPSFSMKSLVKRCSLLLEQLPAEQVERELQRWQELQLTPRPDHNNQALVGFLWQSPLFQTIMSAIGFYPPEDIDIRPYIAPLYKNIQEFSRARTFLVLRCSRGAVARGEIPYWQVVLHFQAPQLYLEPFLPERNLQGCDIGCGWGRISLTLSDYSRRTIHACDLSESSLTCLQKLANLRQLPDVIQTHRVDILSLPFADNFFDFYLAFDIFEHLIDEVLDACLREMLRCGKTGCVLYTETPLMAFCPPLTHLQNWSKEELTNAFEAPVVDGKRWKLKLWDPLVADHFTFVIEAVL